MASKVQVVEFELGDRVLATRIENVREIVEKSDPTNIPNTPDSVEGVINLRGETATLLNPKPVLEIEESSGEGRILVVEDEDNTGILVDSVNEVYEVDQGDIEDTEKFDEEELSEAVYRSDKANTDEYIIIVDISRLKDRITEETKVQT